jgi:hypothetical protein
MQWSAQEYIQKLKICYYFTHEIKFTIKKRNWC